MYEDYYGFVEKPFSLTPDPKYIYWSQSHVNTFDVLQYAIDRRDGFAVITGDIGTGKTTLCRALLEQTDKKTFTALLLNPFLSEEDLLKAILRDFGVISRRADHAWMRSASRQDLIVALHEFLLSLLPLGARAVLIIDEAQNLPLPILEQIRILSNLETATEKLLQVVLIGQSNLTPLLQSPELRQLDQRISVRYQLHALESVDDVTAYITHRVAVARARRTVVFTHRALQLIYRYSAGIPRVINLLCDRALLAAYAGDVGAVTGDLVKQAAGELGVRGRSRGGPQSWFGRVRQAIGLGGVTHAPATV
jgi:general secretion pathway protein A